MKKDWEIKKLGDVCEVIAGQSPEGKFYNQDKKGTPFYQGKKDFGLKYLDKPTVWTTVETKIALENDILMSVRAPVGDINICTSRVCIGRGLAAIRASEAINNDFLFYFLLSIKAKITGKEGAVFASINRQEIAALQIPVPPLEEQKRIVKILDEKFAQLETIKTNAQSNLQNAKDFFQSQLAKAFSNTTWKKKRLEDVCEIITGPFGSSIHKTDYVPNGIPMINPQNIVDGYIIPLEKCLVSENTAKNLERFKFIENDIVIARRGEMGRCAVIRKENENWLCGTGSFIIRSNSRKVNSDFLQTILSSKESKEKLEKESIGATMPNLNQGILGNFEVPLPPLPEQKRIVKELDTLSEKVKALQNIYEQMLLDCEELKQSLLAKAFEGNL